MNKSLDERLVPNGEYIDALNIRLGSTEASEVGSVENTKGNTRLTTLKFIDVSDTYNGTSLSAAARCIGSYADGANETIYWFIHDSNYTASGDGGVIDNATSKLDFIVSYNTIAEPLVYPVISINDGSGTKTTLNFDDKHLITGVDLVETYCSLLTTSTRLDVLTWIRTTLTLTWLAACIQTSSQMSLSLSLRDHLSTRLRYCPSRLLVLPRRTLWRSG